MTGLLGIDLGTSSVKVVVIDEEGDLLAQSTSRYPISTPLPGWAEQDPEQWWTAVKESIRAILQSSRIKPEEIRGIGLSGQMHGTVLLDEGMKILRPAVIWADNRSQAQCERIYQILGEREVLEITFNPIMPGFMAPSLLWVKENEPSIFRRISKVLFPKDYIRFKLTRSIDTDVSDASASLLFDVKKREWSHEIISSLNFREDFFPPVHESIEVVGELSEEASQETSLPKGIPVVAGGGDSPVGAVGCGLITPGMSSVNIGSAGQIFTVLESPMVDKRYRVHTFCHAVPDRWYVQGAILSAGLALDWFVMNLILEGSLVKTDTDIYSVMFKEAETVPPGSDGLIFMPYLLGERSPHMDPKARGVLFGLTVNHRRAHIVRAIMEGVAYALRDSLEIFKEIGIEVKGMIARGGGVRNKTWRKILADVLNHQLLTVEVEEASFGAALLSGVGAGVYRDLEEAVKMAVKVRDVTDPDLANVKIYERLYHDVFRKLYPVLRDYFKLL